VLVLELGSHVGDVMWKVVCCGEEVADESWSDAR